jgi:ribonucleoside-diphosphate reductase alpha chain
MTERAQLPNRRPSQTIRFEHDNHRYYVTLGYATPEEFLTNTPLEVFLDAGQPGSALQHVTRDAAVVLSIALQFGAPISVLRQAMTRLDNGAPAGPIGCMLDMIGTQQ